MMDRNIGKKLDGRYEITELIGIGGMADVYKAIDIIDDRVVAVKILKTEFSNDEEFLRRFRNESKAIAVLSHPNIVKIYDVGFTEKIQFIVMEYIDGITLKEFMEQQGILKWKDAIHFVIQILRALQHAHDRGIVHRDIKPQNIMLFPDGTIKVMDFGIARFAREEGKTLSDKAIGSVHYISPEQARGDITDEKSDIYSIGVMLYEMLTGQKPFDADNPVSVALMHMQSKARNPREINETIPEGLEDIVVRAMQKDANKRYQSASEMIKDIEEFKRNPSIVFEYKYLTPPIDENTRFFTPVNASSNAASTEGGTVEVDRNKIMSKVPKMFKQKAKPKPQYDDYDDDDYDEDEYDDYDDDDDDDDDYYDDRRRRRGGGGRSLIVPVLGAITAAVVIIAAFFITNMIIKMISPYGTETYTMPNLVGVPITEAQSQYPYFRITELSEEYSEYPAGVIIEQPISEGSSVKAGREIKVKVSRGIRMIPVPDVTNYEQTRAISILKDAGFYVSTTSRIDDNVPAGFVIETDPPANTNVKYGSALTIYVSLGAEQEDIIMPDLQNMKIEEAQKLLTEKKLVTKIQTVDSREEAGTVLTQSVPYLDVVQPGTEIILEVSTGTISLKSYYLTVPIPEDAEGSYTFTAFVDGEEVTSVAVDDVYRKEKVQLTISGSEHKTVIVEIKYAYGIAPVKLAEYSMDFETGKFYQVAYYDYAFKEAKGY